MTQDALLMSVITDSLNKNLSGGKVNRVVFTSADDIILYIYNGASFQLLISVNPQNCRIHLTETSINPFTTNSSFYLLLRKLLVGSKIKSVTQTPFERAVAVNFTSKDALGYEEDMHLIAELTGKTSNLLIVNSQNIIKDALKRNPLDLNRTSRQLVGGLVYQPLTSDEKISPSNLEKINESIFSSDELAQKICGVGTQTVRFIETLEGKYGNKVGMFLSMLKNPSPVVILKNKIPHQILPMKQQLVLFPDAEFKEFNDINHAYDYFFSFTNNTTQDIRSQLSKTVNAAVSKLNKKITAQKEEFNLAQNSDTNRIYGELILSQLHTIKQGDLSATLNNYYDNTQATVQLDATLSPAQNAQRYFKKYAKQKNAVENLTKQLAKNTMQLDYLHSILNNVSLATTHQDFAELSEEISNFTKPKQSKAKKQSAKPNSPTKYLINGFIVYLGRNNLQNEEVTFKLGGNNDLWLHAKGIPSAHMIIVSGNTPIDSGTLQTCAEIVAFSSKFSNEPKVEIDYTFKKHVKKPSGAPPGFVIYTNQKSLLVTPDKHGQLICPR